MPTFTRTDTAWLLDLGADENRFSPDWLAAVESGLPQVAEDPAGLPLITSGQGKFFSNGLDLEWVLGHRDQFGDYLVRVERLLSSLLLLPVPTVAAINGHAFGAGAMLALCHDQRVMRADRGYFCFPEVDLLLAFTPWMQRLISHTVPAATARIAMTTGRRYGGQEVVTAGIVQQVAGAEELPGLAGSLVDGLAGKDRRTLSAIKAALFAEVTAALGTFGKV